MDLSAQPELPENSPAGAEAKDPFLAALGERTRALRARRGMTRKSLAKAAEVSERHLANVEMGVGNASVQFLRQLALALDCSLAELVGDESASSPEWLMIREILRGRSETELAEARASLVTMFGAPASDAARRQRIALIGLRGAGKSSLGRAAAERAGLRFVELDQRVEEVAGMPLADVFTLHGEAWYRRLEREALEKLVADRRPLVVATGGGIVVAADTYELLRRHFVTIWLEATPEDHWNRVVEQGDGRPMQGQPAAMARLREILAERAPLYGLAHHTVDTSALGLAKSREKVEAIVRAAASH
ncbi:MAG TPA: helix-turn-helix transcriptional regulator [Planctomycetota bacterium]|nr:helix-turn-helix transcriptional regulator [Planctomycetota bacterium]